MKIINWAFITNHHWYIDHPECIKPLIPKGYKPFKHLSTEVTAARKGIIFLKCPAHTDFLKNTFIFCAPFDITIDLEIDKTTDSIKVFCENLTQEMFEHLIDIRFLRDDQGISKYPLIGIDWLTTFTTADSTMIQLLPAFMHRNEFTEKTTVIPGEFDISKWTRPVELVFEIRSNKEHIVIKQGDALAYIKFQSEESIKLVEQATPWDEIVECNKIRLADKFRPLQERYASLAEVKDSQCPHLHNKKGP